MTDSIVLHKKQFERWARNTMLRLVDADWQSLVEESLKPKRIEAWALVDHKDGEWAGAIIYSNECTAKQRQKVIGGRIIKLVEEVPCEK